MESKYQTIVRICREGNLELAKKLILNWALEDRSFNMKHAVDIFKRYQLRSVHA